MVDSYLGEIRMFGGKKAPQDWAFCDGSPLHIARYSALFTLLGVTYGGDGITTFNLPNLNGRVPIGTGQGPNLPNYVVGQVTGSETVILTTDQLPKHNHAILASTGVGTPTNTPSPTAGLGPVDPTLKLYVDTAVGHVTGATNFSSNAVSMAGLNGAHNNMMPSLAVNYIISLNGIFPTG